TALTDMSLKANEVVMIGDDIESDIKGAEAMGIRGVLVQTGKFRKQDLNRDDVTSWKTINNISDLPKLLSQF
ncbi:HAD hydrolase-like protein, partial [Calditrichota bacterium]